MVKRTRRTTRKTRSTRKTKKKTSSDYPKQYTAKLSRKDKKKQLTALGKLKKAYSKGKYLDRPTLKSYKNKESGWTAKFHKLYPEAKSIKQVAKAVKIPEKALREVIKKGKGAYYSSGSRPNQTSSSWGKARMYAYILGSPTRRVDHHITEKYKVKFIHKPNFYP